VNGRGTVRESLKDYFSTMEECKADIMGLYILSKLSQMGEIANKNLMNNYVTFMAGTFRSVRFGAANAHGTANMITFNYFEKDGAFTRDEKTNTYSVDPKKMKHAIVALMKEIITIQATGDYERASRLIKENGSVSGHLQSDLNRLNEFSIPVDIIFDQGPEKLGL
jgi:hypothetical protein